MTEFRRRKPSGTGTVCCLEVFLFSFFCTVNRKGARAVNVAKCHKESPNIRTSDHFYIGFDCLENHQRSGSHNRVVTLFRILKTEAVEGFQKIIFLRNSSGALLFIMPFDIKGI